MNIEQLEYLVSVTQTRSMSKAASLHYTSQQNISKSIQNLEKEFNVVLFERKNSGVFLTEQGREIYSHAVNILKDFYDLKSFLLKMNDEDQIKPTTVSIVVSRESYSVFSGLYSKFLFEFPNAKLFVYEDSTFNFPALDFTQYDILF